MQINVKPNHRCKFITNMGIEHVAQPQQKEKINNKRAMPRGHY